MAVSGGVEALQTESREVLPPASEVVLGEGFQRVRIDSDQRQGLSEAFCRMLMLVVKEFGEVVSSVDGVDIGKDK